MMARDAKFSDAMSSMDVNCAGRAGGRRRARRIFAHLAALLLLDELVHLGVDLLQRLEARMRLDGHGGHVCKDGGLEQAARADGRGKDVLSRRGLLAEEMAIGSDNRHKEPMLKFSTALRWQ